MLLIFADFEKDFEINRKYLVYFSLTSLPIVSKSLAWSFDIYLPFTLLTVRINELEGKEIGIMCVLNA